MCWCVLVWWVLVNVWQLIEEVGRAVGRWGGGGGVEKVVWYAVELLRPLAVAAELAGQGLVHVELRGYGAAAVEVQVVLAAQLAVLAQGRLAGRALLFEVAVSRRNQ